MTATLTTDKRSGHAGPDTHSTSAAAPTLSPATGGTDAQWVVAGETDHPAGAIEPATPGQHPPRPGTDSPAAKQDSTSIDSPPRGAGPFLADPFLALHAEVVSDLEGQRIANENRLRALTTLDADSDGVVRGFGLDESHPDVAQLAALVAALGDLEHRAILNLNRAMRKHPLGPWCKAQRGIGEKQAARLISTIGDPYWNTLHNRPRTVSELWAYCGLHVLPVGQTGPDTQRPPAGGDQTGSDPGRGVAETQRANAGVAARRRKGVKSNWNTDAKMRAYLVAVSCMKSNGSPYREVYLNRRAHTLVTHPDWTPGHSHNDALRVASKAILRDLWREAKRLHEEQT